MIAVVKPGAPAGELSAALDEVERQFRSMPRSEILGEEDLEWSIGTAFVALPNLSGGERRAGGLVMRGR